MLYDIFKTASLLIISQKLHLNLYNFISGTRLLSLYVQDNATVYALSSGKGKCGVSIIRLSGPRSGLILKALIKSCDLPTPRIAKLCKLFNPLNNELLDNALTLWFPGPSSFTGQDCCEFHVHGSMAVVNAMFNVLEAQSETRMAQPGEFAKRAFANGKLDLTEVEGLADLIKAETEQQRRAALRIVEGDVKNIYKAWERALNKCRANLEMLIDFSEDQHIETDVAPSLKGEILELRRAIHKFTLDGAKGVRLNDGIRISLVGAPNVGKSSLFNLLCSRSLSIVSPLAGTTRDRVEASRDVAGCPVIYTDTAGINEDLGSPENFQDGGHRAIELQGVNRAKAAIAESDVLMLILDGSQHLTSFQNSLNLDPQRFWKKWAEILESSFENYVAPSLVGDGHKCDFQKILLRKTAKPLANKQDSETDVLFVVNKWDLLQDDTNKRFNEIIELAQCPYSNLHFVSCENGYNVENLMKTIAKCVELKCGDPLEGNPMIHSHRQMTRLKRSLAYLDEILAYDLTESNYLFMSRALQKATLELSQLTGQRIGTTEDILDVIFKEFCIGK